MRLRAVPFLALALSLVLSGCVSSDYVKDAARRARPFTSALPEPDRVELLHIASAHEKVVAILSTVKLHGNAAREFARLWRQQRYDLRKSAFCHAPVFAVRFYRGDHLLSAASICFFCHNVVSMDGQKMGGGLRLAQRSSRGIEQVIPKGFS